VSATAETAELNARISGCSAQGLPRPCRWFRSGSLDRELCRWPNKEGVAIRLQDAADKHALTERGPACHLLRQDVDLPPAPGLERADRGAEQDAGDARPQDG